jgi:hypothetical protein
VNGGVLGDNTSVGVKHHRVPGPNFIFVGANSVTEGDEDAVAAPIPSSPSTPRPAQWSYQLVHHDLWDYDIPAQPSLATISLDGKERDVVIQGTKQGLVFSKTISLSQIRSISFRHSSHRPSTTPARRGA